MSWLSKATGIHWGNIGAPVGAALGSFIPGVGTALGAGLGQAVGGIGSGKPVGQSLAQGAGVYAGGKLLGKGLDAMHVGGPGGIDTAGLIKKAIGVGGPAVAGQPSGGLGGLGGLLGKAGEFLGGNNGMNALGIAQGVNAAHLGQQSTDYANKAFDFANNSYKERAPLRALGIQGLTQPKAPNVSGIAATTGANPFSRQPLGVR